MFKSDSKDIYNITNDFYFKEMLFFWTFYSLENPKKICITVSTKILGSKNSTDNKNHY